MKQRSVLAAIAAIAKSVLYAFLFYAAQSFFTGLILGLYAARQNPATFSDLQSALNEGARGYLFQHTYQILLFSAAAFLAAAALIPIIRKESPRERLSLRKAPASAFGAGFFSGFGAFLIAVFATEIAYNLFSVFQQSADSYAQQEALLSGPLVFELLYVCLVGPIAEEVLCRSLILGTLRKAFSDRTAILLSAVAFALIHGNLYQIFYTLPLGILLAYLAVRSGSVFPSVLLHITFNSSNYLIQIGRYLGLEEDGAAFRGIYYGQLAFFALCIPLAVWFFHLLDKKKKSAAAPSGDPSPFSPPFAAGPVFQEVNPAVSQPEYLIAGLGNPGESYASTRHNAGFMAIDYMAIRDAFTVKTARFSALCGDGMIEGKRVLYLKPQTFMNLSGRAVAEAARFYHIPPEKIVVIYDDVSFLPGEFRVRPSGSAGGHNGMKSIIEALGTDAFPRIRIGVGAAPEGRDLMHWVLSSPVGPDLDRILSALENVRLAARLIVSGKIDEAMNRYNSKNK